MNLQTMVPVDASPTATPSHQYEFDGTKWRPRIGAWKYLNITTGATTTVKTGAGVLHAIIVNKGVLSATVKLCDALTNTTPVIGTFTYGLALLSDPPRPVLYDVAFDVGLTIVTSGATDLTVVYV